MAFRIKNGVGRFEELEGIDWLLHGFSSREMGDMGKLGGSGKKFSANQQKMAETIGINVNRVFCLKQVHGTEIIKIDEFMLSNFSGKRLKIVEGDGLMSNTPGVGLFIKTADCIPLILVDPVNRACGLLHVGFAGAIGKIFWKAVILMADYYKSRPADLKIAIGPCICGRCYKLENPIQAGLFEWGEYLSYDKDGVGVDLVDFVVDSLVSVGVRRLNIFNSGICTFEDKRFYSYRGRGQAQGALFGAMLGIKV